MKPRSSGGRAVRAVEGMPENDAREDSAPPSSAARGYSWPPFEPGNTAARTHGIYSARLTAPIAAEIAKQLRNEVDYLRTPRFADALASYAATMARIQLMQEFVDGLTIERQIADGEGKTSPSERLRQLVRRSVTLAAELGLVPVVTDDVQHEITLARQTLARRADRARLQSDLRANIAQQMFGDTNKGRESNG